MSGYAVRTHDLAVRYGRTEALSKVTLDLASGRIHGLLGRNGTGKTTLMATLASFRAPHRGSVQIDGHDPFEDELLMAGICLIRESGDIFDDETASTTLDIVQRSALGAVIGLASRAPLTMFDEVHLGMDAPTRQQFYDELIADFAERPRTIILASHLISEVESFLETVTILAGKTILLSDESDRLRTQGITLTGPTAAVERICAGHTIVGHETLDQPVRSPSLRKSPRPRCGRRRKQE